MHTVTQNRYQGWNIKVFHESKMCSNYSFTITNPEGKTQTVEMGGDNIDRALERAREMIDSEESLKEYTDS